MSKFKKTAAAIVLGTTLVTGAMTPAFAEPAKLISVVQVQAAAYQYVALGDSVTSGYEPGMTLTSMPYGFVERLHEQALYKGRAKVANYGILGLTSDGMRNYLKLIVEGKAVKGSDIEAGLPDPRIDKFGAEIAKAKASITSANLVTITIGSNDFQKLIPVLMGKSEEEAKVIIEESIAKYADNLGASLALLIQINPKAKIAVADIYQPYSTDVPFVSEAYYVKLSQIRDKLTETVDAVVQASASQGADVKAVHVAQSFAGHEIGYTHIGESDPHPTQKGFDVMAKGFAETIFGSYTSPQKKAAITMIVNGKALVTPYAPLNISGRTFVPIREYTQALGAKVTWDNKARATVIAFAASKVTVKENSDIIVVNGKKIKIEAKVRMQQGKMYVPLAALAQGLGFDVTYVAKSNTAYINK